MKFKTPTVYYYCPDYKKYVKREGEMYYCIKDGKEVFNDFYSKIDLGSIYRRYNKGRILCSTILEPFLLC